MIKATQTLEQTLLDLVRQLPLERQKQVVDFVRFLDIETRRDSDDENDLLATGFSSLKHHLNELEHDVSKEEMTSWLASFDRA
jgi:hypothetical protein